MDAEHQNDIFPESDAAFGKDMSPESEPSSGGGTVPEAVSGAGKEPEAPRRTLEELEQENQRLREEHELLLKEYRASLPLKERMYDRVPLTVRQLDVIIGFLLAALVAVVILGLVDR